MSEFEEKQNSKTLAKVTLYYMLMEQDLKETTQEDIDIMVMLSKDSGVVKYANMMRDATIVT